jgi:hypothetical protein
MAQLISSLSLRASADVEEQQGKKVSGTIILSELPPRAAEALRSFDVDGDGLVDVDELLHASRLHEKAVNKALFYRRLFVILFGVFMAQLGSMFGIVFGVVDYTRTTNVAVPNTPGTLPVMTNKAGDQVLSVASLATPMAVSSVMPDTAWAQLKQFAVTNAITNSSISLNVLGWARIQTTAAQYGSIIRVITFAGTISLDGRQMSFTDSVAPIFAEAGFQVALSRRRLLDLSLDIVGFFNYLATFDLNALEAAATSRGASSLMALSNTTFTSLPAAYRMTTVSYQLCDASTTSVPSWCSSSTAAELTTSSPDFSGRFFTSSADIVTDGTSVLTTTTYSYTGRVDKQNGTTISSSPGCRHGSARSPGAVYRRKVGCSVGRRRSGRDLPRHRGGGWLRRCRHRSRRRRCRRCCARRLPWLAAHQRRRSRRRAAAHRRRRARAQERAGDA